MNTEDWYAQVQLMRLGMLLPKWTLAHPATNDNSERENSVL